MRGDRQFLRAAEIAASTGVSLRTVRRLIADKTLPSLKIGGTRLVPAEALERLVRGAGEDDFGDEVE